MTTGTLPKGWAEESLGRLADFVRGVTFKPTDVVGLGDEGSVACMRTKNVQTELDLDDVLGIPTRFVKREEQYLQPGDLLVSSANSWNLVGKCSWVGELPWRSTFGGFVTTIRPDASQVDPRYLYRWFSHPRTQATLRSFGRKTTSISNLNLGQTKSMPVPLPPIEEQRRIAAVLDQADELRAKRRAALVLLDTLVESIFLDMFGTLVAETALGEVADVQGGVQVTSKRASNPIEVPYLRVANVFRSRLDLAEIKTIRVTSSELERVRLEPDDLLVVEAHGNPAEVGRVGRWDGSIPECVHQNHLIRVRTYPNQAHPVFVERFMNSVVGRRDLLRAANTTSGLNGISTSDVRAVRIPLPPLEEQQRFAGLAACVGDASRSETAAAGQLDDLFTSLQQRAFRGEL